jgi:hypothetical protein
MSVHFQVVQRFGGGVFASREEAEAHVRSQLTEADPWFSKFDVVEFEDGQQVFFDNEIKVSNVDRFEDKLHKLNRKAIKLGLIPLVARYGEKRMVVVHKEDPLSGEKWKERYEVVALRVLGQEVKLNGFEFFGRVDNEGGAALVCSVPGKEMPVQYRKLDNYCDHCKVNRHRKAYYVFKSEAGEFLKVGSTCLKDYMGHNAAQVLMVSTLDQQVGDCADEDDRSPREPSKYSVNLMMLYAAAVIREQNGYVSNAAAQAYAEKSKGEGQLVTTASLVDSQLTVRKPYPKDFEPVKVLEVDRRVAQKAKAWFKAELARKADKGQSLSDYEHNLGAVVDQVFVSLKRLGLVVSLVGVYLRKMGELAERQAREANYVNAHMGKVGERRMFSGKFVSQNSFESQWGVTIYTRFATPEGMVTVKSSGQWWDGDLEKDVELSFLATVKQHKEWKGRLETVVNRAVQKSRVDAPPVAA